MSNHQDTDEGLLARLNALRQSNITLHKGSSLDRDDLSQRLRALRSAGLGSDQHQNQDPEQWPNKATLNHSAIVETAEILQKSQRDSRLDEQELKEIKDALKDARTLLDESGDQQAGGQHITTTDGQRDQERHSRAIDADDVTEQDIDRLLEELNLDGNGIDDSPPAVATPASSSEDEEALDLELPSAPTEIQKQFCKVDMTLPSVPSSAPAAQSGRHTDSKTTIPPQSKSFTEPLDVDSWCIICCDDATLKCIGCDGDLYCETCWTEGHRGEDAGLEERSHRAIAFVQKKKKPQRQLA